MREAKSSLYAKPSTPHMSDPPLPAAQTHVIQVQQQLAMPARVVRQVCLTLAATAVRSETGPDAFMTHALQFAQVYAHPLATCCSLLCPMQR